MLSFENDYNKGAHPKILAALFKTNDTALSGYGEDQFTKSAKEKIKEACGLPEAEVYFLAGGTQTNMIVIATMLRDYEGVVAAVTGHISQHEAGSIEYSGHEVLTIPEHQGKILASELEAFIKGFYADENHEHMVFPGMVYLSHPTEYGTLYTKEELTAIHKVTEAYEIPLFLDGARLGYGLMSDDTDLTLMDIAELTDVFYIGGTKVGALCGEAVVFTKKNMPAHFVNSVKKRGGLLAKGRLLGVQFDTLFTDDLYFEISRHAILMAEKLKELLKRKGYRFFLESPTNQQFVILKNEEYERLRKEVALSFWEKSEDTETVVRFATSWATTDEELERLEEIL